MGVGDGCGVGVPVVLVCNAIQLICGRDGLRRVLHQGAGEKWDSKCKIGGRQDGRMRSRATALHDDIAFPRSYL